MNDRSNSSRRNNENRNSQDYYLYSSCQIGGYSTSQSSNRLNFQRMANSSERERQPHIRTFCEGRESETETEQYQSLHEQRTNANQQRGRINRRFNNRGHFRGRKNIVKRNRSRCSGSDTESISSSDSLPQFSQPSLNFSFTYKKPTHSHSVSEPPKLFSHNSTTSIGVDDYIDCNTNIESISKDFNSTLKCQKSELATYESGTENCNQRDLNNIALNPSIKSSRHMLSQYQNLLKDLDPMQVIMDCRQQIDDNVKEPIFQCLTKIKEINDMCIQNRSSVFKLHLENLMQQQKQFEAYITEVKGHLSLLFTSNIQDLLEKCDKIEKDIKKECNIFRRSLPTYAYKDSIIKKIHENQVTIISADISYFLNILVPIFVKSKFPDHFLVCSETSQLSTESLRKNVFQLMHDKIQTDEIEDIMFKKEMSFLTVDEMLNLFSDDNTFREKNIFAILNLSLKRSLQQDIVLSHLKDILQENKNSKIVLLTTFIDNIQKYETYFSGKISVGTLKMPTLTLPVKTFWKNMALQPTDDYVSEIVRTVLAIHTLNDSGDIMAFLPTSADTKSALTLINQKLSDLQFSDLKCDILNENSTQKQCLELFSKRPSNKRTVFFVTDCAEVLVIPSICYVIDCGLQKEYIFDGDKKIDVLSTTFISRSKLKLRKSLAGSFGVGACYRLYSKEDYKEMPHCEYPEILTINPFNSMIKIFQHRPGTATTIEFVESLPESAKKSALESLKKYNAIKDNTLTDLGKNIVKLPFPAKYSKLILLGIHWGLAFEAVILVAFFSVKGRVFQFSSDHQREIDAVKLSLIQHDSDTLSFLHIYKMWLDNNCSVTWCEKYYINYSTLKCIDLKVNEICQIVGESLKENINQEFVNIGNNATTSLLEMLFDCFLENLCVFTGHYKSGYRVLSSHCIAFLHPSSIICQTENLPRFIIFDHMICTNREFLISITSIPPDFITKAMVEQQIDFDYSDMFEKSLVQRIIEPVGERMIKQVLLGKKGMKLKAIEVHVKSFLSTDSLVIEPVAEKGHVLVFALENQVDEALKLVNDMLERQFQDLINLEQVHTLELKRGQITLPVELKWLRGAQVASVKVGKSSQVVANDGKEFAGEENPCDQQPCITQQSVNITWMRRPCNGKGFVTFCGEDFVKARKLTMKNFSMLNSTIFVQTSRNEKNQLFITEIPKEAKTTDLEELFSKLLPGVKPIKIELKYSAPFETSENELLEIKEKITEICTNYTNLTNFEVVVPLPKQTATVMKAFINVNNKEGIELAAENLSKYTLGNAKLVCKPVYRSIIKCSLKICEALTPQFQHTLTELQNKLKKKFVLDEFFKFDFNQTSDDLAVIKMLSNKLEILQMLHRVVNELLEGEILNKSFSYKLNKIFCHGGHMWLSNLEKTSKVHIIEDYNNKTLRLYGSKENCRRSMQRILQFLEDSTNEAVAVIPLSGKRRLLKEIIKKYGANLEKFIESSELQTAVLDIRACSISLHGNQDSIEKAEDCLKELAATLHTSDSSDVISSVEKCPLCLCPAFNLTSRLELCGHLYCCECIEGLLDQAEFPLRCCEEDCCHDIVLDDICKVLGDDPAKIKVLLEKSLKHYIEKHADEIVYCPAPDCSMFFFKTEIVDDKHNCPLCQNDICIKCNVVYHHGYTCDIYQGSKNDPDYSFKLWQQKSAECKRCPKCNTAIEKNGGCDHMTCKNCSSHFCWVCVREFPDADSVYRHLPFCDKYPRW